MTCRPGHAPRAPDFEPGNTASVVHGATSPRAIEKRAEEVHAKLLEVAPYLREPKFAPAAGRYLAAATREGMLHQHIESVVAERGAGAVPSRVWEQATAAARLAAKLASDLGLDPLGHARIRSLAVGAERDEASLEELMRAGRARRLRSTDAGAGDSAPRHLQRFDPPIAEDESATRPDELEDDGATLQDLLAAGRARRLRTRETGRNPPTRRGPEDASR